MGRKQEKVKATDLNHFQTLHPQSQASLVPKVPHWACVSAKVMTLLLLLLLLLPVHCPLSPGHNSIFVLEYSLPYVLFPNQE